MIFNDLIDKYKTRYSIPFQDLKDFGETNRINALVVSSLFLLSEIIDFFIVLVIQYSILKENFQFLIYLCIYTPINLFIFLFSRHSKNAVSYIRKTFPAYLLLFVGLSASVFNFYFMDSPHNGFVTYYLAGFLFLIVFSSSPLLFFFELIPTAAILSPGVYKNYGVLSVVDLFVVTIIMFAIALYKRHHEKRHLQLLRKQKLVLEAKTFGNFTLLHENKVITFSRTKSEELLGYLIYKKGTSVKTKELINVLWGDHADSARYGNSFRNLVVDIKHTMNELEIQNFFITEYNNFRINPEVIRCDYYDFLEGEPTAIKSFAGEFMSQYSWAEEIAAFLEQKSRNN